MNTFYIQTKTNILKYRTQIFAGILVIVLVVSGYVVYLHKRDPIAECHKITDSTKKVLCWKAIVDKKLDEGKLDESMNLVAELFNTEPEFAANCHDFMHTVGKTAYDLFSKGVKFNVGSNTSYCAYGFYHGFMENLIVKNGNISMAQSFCEYVDKELSRNAPGAKLACYHGIGHGWTNVHDQSLYGNERAMVSPALALCEKVTQDPEELKICATGVFDSISIGYYNQDYGLKINKNDPYWLCREQKQKYQAPCYMDLSPAIVWLGDYKLDKALTYVSKVDPKFKDLVIITISEDMVRFIINNKENPEDQIKICRSLGTKENIICLQGLVGGYLQFGAPGKEEELAVNFCNLGILSAEEKDACYSKMIKNIKIGFSPEKLQKVCNSIDNEFKKYCSQ